MIEYSNPGFWSLERIDKERNAQNKIIAKIDL